MTKPSNYMLILVAGLSDENLRMLDPILYSYKLGDVVNARVIWCRSVGASGLGPFVHVNAKHRADDEYVDAHIPNSIILSIVGSENPKAMGFQWAEESQSPKSASAADGEQRVVQAEGR
jgi:hypothetical protein